MLDRLKKLIALCTAVVISCGVLSVPVPAQESLSAESLSAESLTAEALAPEALEAEDEDSEAGEVSDEDALTASSETADPEESQEDLDPETEDEEPVITDPMDIRIFDKEKPEKTDNDDGELVIVLDPGHDRKHTGSEAKFGDVECHEEQLVVLIAKYMKRKLMTYDNVKVYLTHDGSSEGCPFDAADDTDCLKSRVAFAKSVKADYFISLHLNKSPGANATGLEMLYPNENYDPEIGQEGMILAEVFSRKLQELGITVNSIHSRNSDDQHYPDKSTADFYSVIRNSKLVGITGIIVEHCHMDIQEEYEDFLSDNEKLKELAIADAEAMAEYLGLTRY